MSMDSEGSGEVSVSLDDVKNIAELEGESSKIDLVVEMSSDGRETSCELEMADKFLTKMELDLACASEKLVNLNVLMMHVATKESEFEIETTKGDGDYSVEALEFDLLSRILDSELTQLDNFMIISKNNVVEVRKMISSYEHSSVAATEEKLCDSEKSLKQLQDQISEIREQSVKFQKTLSCLNSEEHWHGNVGANASEDSQFLDMNAKIKMQTAEQQRHILRMLEKSLAKEMDLEKKLTESRHIEEELKNRLISTEQEVFFMEEEVVDICERCFTAENAAEVLKGISQELLNRLQILQFNLNGSIQRETELRSRLENSIEQLETKENALQKLSRSGAKFSDSLLSQTDSLKASLLEAEDKLILANSEASGLREKLSSLEKQLEEMGHLKVTSEKVDSLEKQLQESDIQLQHAVASVDASQERQNMLDATIRDMENLIEELKFKVLKAESRADNAEDKCIVLSESNAELAEELSFLRGKLVSLEASLNRADETKMATARDIGIRTKVVMDLVMQLSIERERLRKQMTSLALDNRTLVVKLQQTGKAPFVATNHLGESNLFSEREKTQISGTGSKRNKTKKIASVGEMAAADSTIDPGDVRRIDAGVLNRKHLFMAVLVLLISAAVYLFQPQNLNLRQ